MFSDLVGSTALSARIDPEDLRKVISAYQKCVAETVQRFGGFVAKYMGDGVLIYFGYPQAHEDDAERAVRAGLELIAAVSALKAPVSLQTRVGIATGLVVVGDLIGSGEAQHDTNLTPLVGRDEELELLVRRWRQAADGEGRVVLLSGEPGIGKSRLIVALEEQLQTEQYTPLRFFCSPLHTDSTLYPFISQLERAAGF